MQASSAIERYLMTLCVPIANFERAANAVDPPRMMRTTLVNVRASNDQAFSTASASCERKPLNP
jgi:hypothetical protein